MTKLIYVASAWRSSDELNRRHNRDRALRICREISMAGDVPVATHLLFPQFLDDADHVERGVGLRCALTLLTRCDELQVYGDTVTEGMTAEIAAAERIGLRVVRIGGADAKVQHCTRTETPAS